MSRASTVELSDGVYSALGRRAQAAAPSPAELAAALEQRFGAVADPLPSGRAATDADRQAARVRFERHFGAVDLGSAPGAGNASIDVDLARLRGRARGGLRFLDTAFLSGGLPASCVVR